MHPNKNTILIQIPFYDAKIHKRLSHTIILNTINSAAHVTIKYKVSNSAYN